MKKTLTALIFMVFTTQSFSYTLGDVYINTPESSDKVLLNQSNNMVYQKFIPTNNIKYQITTNNENQITRIDYSGQVPIDMKNSLGKYYESYNQAWLNRANKSNHSYSIIDTNNVHVENFGFGNKLFLNSIQLKQQ